MLVLSRKRSESIVIGDEIEVMIVDIRGDKVRLGVTAPESTSIHRLEVYRAIQKCREQKSPLPPEVAELLRCM